MPAASAPSAARRGFKLVLLSAVIAAGLAWLAFAFARAELGAASNRTPEEFAANASPAALALIERAFADVDPARLVDYHVHVAGVGAGGTGCTVNAKMTSWRHPWPRTQFLFFMDASGVTDLERADAQFVERLSALVRGAPRHGRYGLLAFDRTYKSDGTPDDEHTQFHVPNDYVFELARAHPDLYAPVISVHPYRSDALLELDRCAARGARLLKWLPNAMHIDPADPRCDAFYDKLVQHDIALLTHTGEEKAVHAEGTQDLGNPLRLRRPLERGVKVIAAHCASLGESVDLDDPSHPKHSNFALFLRLMDDSRYTGRLFGELSAVIQSNRSHEVLATLLERADLHARLVNGSDWPLPAINVVIWTKSLAKAGFLTDDERAAINEVYEYNPLLFDFVLKRTLHHPRTGARFPAHVFHARRELPP